MRSLGRPEVLRSAIIAGLGSALVCWPRIATAPRPRYPAWYLEAVVLLGSILLWGFVFAWHTRSTPAARFYIEGGYWALSPGDHYRVGSGAVLALCARPVAAGQSPRGLPHHDRAMAGDDPLQPGSEATLRGLRPVCLAHTVVWQERTGVYTHGHVRSRCRGHPGIPLPCPPGGGAVLSWALSWCWQAK